MLVDIGRAGLDSYAFATQLLRSTGVAVALGLPFGQRSDHLIRISICVVDEEFKTGVGRLYKFYHDLIQD
jgi:aspartate/methionine/tyrosine aminotransferase